MKRPDVSAGTILTCSCTATGGLPGFLPVNIVNGFGLYPDAPDTHDAHKNGATMWLGSAEPGETPEIVFEFDDVFPVGTMSVWNYNQAGAVDRGIKQAAVSYSVDAILWHDLFPSATFAIADGHDNAAVTDQFDCGGISARYIRIRPVNTIGKGNWGATDEQSRMLFGLSEVRFAAGHGFMVYPQEEWTALFRRHDGWTGADGIFSIGFDGVSAPGSCGGGKTLFLFSDTFVGTVDPGTARRTSIMLNNTLGILEGCLPERAKFEFIYRTAEDGRHGNIFDPEGIDHFALEGKKYFWLQDGIILKDTLYITALNVFHDPDGPEGLKFGIDGVSLITCPVTASGPDIDNYSVTGTPLYHNFGSRGKAFIGCGILANTAASQAPDPDGYIYIYGYINKDMRSDLVVSRTRSDAFADFTCWEYYSGGSWSKTLADATVVAENVSHELSVTPVREGRHKGEYILVFQKDIAGHLVCCRFGSAPYGPFGPMIDLYHTDEWQLGQGITTYNAKAHPRLSDPGKLLISYNVNTLSGETHIKNGDVYRPRFIVLEEL